MTGNSTRKVREIIRWFAERGEKHGVGTWVETDVSKLRADQYYGLKCFLLYANQRNGCPRGYAVAGIKAVSICERDGRSLKELPSIFEDLYLGSKNRRAMPAMDPRFAELNVPRIVAQVEAGEMRAAFCALDLRGAGHKIKSFFLRDIAITTKSDRHSWTPGEQYIYCQPIDIWVRLTVGCLMKNALEGFRIPALPAVYGFYGDDKKKAAQLIALSLEAGVSPLHVNHGIWYFGRHGVEEAGRLQHLLQTGEADVLRAEIDLMGPFAEVF